jgi:hypothetical protein
VESGLELDPQFRFVQSAGTKTTSKTELGSWVFSEPDLEFWEKNKGLNWG